MKELDLLKKDWKKSENSFVPVSENEIYKMIHKRSSSIVKWIFVISILEFVVLNGVGLLISDKHSQDIYGIDKYINLFQILAYGINFFFMFLFYKNYRNISATSNTKKLMESILKTRKTVKYYIGCNLIYLFFMISGIFTVVIFKNHYFDNKDTLKIIYASAAIFAVILVIIGIVWVFYNFLYGFLLKKLKRNYAELKKIDS
jgi:hypothetical protein